MSLQGWEEGFIPASSELSLQMQAGINPSSQPCKLSNVHGAPESFGAQSDADNVQLILNTSLEFVMSHASSVSWSLDIAVAIKSGTIDQPDELTGWEEGFIPASSELSLQMQAGINPSSQPCNLSNVHGAPESFGPN